LNPVQHLVVIDMAITVPPSKDCPLHAKRKSLGYDDLLLSAVVNRATGVSPLEVAQRARRRRISQGGGWAKGRDRSPNQQRPLPGVVIECLVSARNLGRNYIRPVIAWMFVLIPAIWSLLLFFVVLVVVSEPVVATVNDVACHVSPPAFPRWLSTLPGPFKGRNICAYPSQTAEQALLDDPTAVKTVNVLLWPSTAVQQLQRHHSDTVDAIFVGDMGARMVKREQHPHPRGLEVASLLDEWAQRHEESHELTLWLVDSQKSLRDSISSEARDVAKRNMAYIESNPTGARFEELKSVWIPGYFTHTPIGRVVLDLERTARKHIQHAKAISETVPGMLQALERENKVLENLKVMLPLNWNEILRPANCNVRKDLNVLQSFLQYDFEQWLQSSLTLAVRFQKESDMLAEKLTDTALALRQVRWNRRGRARAIRLWKAHIDDLRTNLGDARVKHYDGFTGESAQNIG
jgi:hypothetical protein